MSFISLISDTKDAKDMDLKKLSRPFPYGSIPTLSSSCLIGGVNLEIPMDSGELLIDQLYLVLGNIPELSKYEFDSDYYYWEIEYGTRPPEYNVPEGCYPIIINGKWAAIFASLRAIEKFPHNIENDDDVGEDLDIIRDQKKWHKSELRLYYNKENKKYVIHFNRMRGNSESFYYTWTRILTLLLRMNNLPMPEKFINLVNNFK